ncbi:histidine phosphatase family protein [Paenibacillus aceris]|uniref:2,3-bisphosphoglycerate-dependent phosphoglycerate mutase n=1 Tax=Paenibacillus aceris TaxID=869555 RepID=A0ABS4HX96_9BACL|nr:histidine phosphatase family protein [Paenibacillus aceris]MBP1963272.1 2,3-bisphosphoglycerate-dependent phosphoglycerate mutase [Paenibacillus aceris]NHW36219.1 histidine phosphatase family protein [Paenibacillus aceris]
MRTFIYFVRHAESPYFEGMERSRGLSDKGKLDVLKINEILKDEEFDVFISSPYERAIQTINGAAGTNKIILYEELREREIGQIENMSFMEAKLKLYKDINFSFSKGESTIYAQRRAVNVIENILKENMGKKIVIGTHGDIMTLILNYFDNRYDFEFWESTSIPDIYKLEFEEQKLIELERLWN